MESKEEVSFLVAVAITLTTAFLVNLPLGRWRSKTRKFSLPWFLYVHLSIPLIIWLRYHFGLGIILIPFTIGSAVLGQFLGGHRLFIIKNKSDRRGMR